MKSSKKIFFSFIFNFYLILLVFDPMRESIDFGILNAFLSIFRDLCIFSMFFYIFLLKEKKKNSVYLFMISFSLIILLILSFFTDIDQLQNLQSIYAISRSFFLCYVILNLPNFYKYNKEFLLKYFINLAVLDFLVTLFFYFIRPDLVTGRKIALRISVGNPSMQSILFTCSFVLCFYYQPFQKKIINVFLSALLFFAAAFTITSTAYIALAFFIIFMFLNKKYFIDCLMICSLIIVIGIIAIIVLEIDFSRTFKLFSVKIREVFLVFSKYLNIDTQISTGYNSFSIREEQIARFISNLTPEFFLFGDGIFSMIDQKKYMIENTYIALIKDFGIFGFLIYLFFLLSEVKKSIVNYKKNKKGCSLIILVIICIYAFTLYIPASNSMMVQFYLVFSIAKWMDKNVILEG